MYTYCSVYFGSDRTYWYRTNERGYTAGMKVIVPVRNNGIWEIGTIASVLKFNVNDLPYPLTKTKGIVQKAGYFSKLKVFLHNYLIQNSKYPPIDISVATVETPKGDVTYCTCDVERGLFRLSMKNVEADILLIENYPASDVADIPLDAKKKLEERLQSIGKTVRGRSFK